MRLNHPIINLPKPGAFWRYLLSLRNAAAIVMGSDVARSYYQRECRRIRMQWEEQHSL